MPVELIGRGNLDSFRQQKDHVKTQREGNIYKPRREIKTTLPNVDTDSISDFEVSVCKPHSPWTLVTAALANKQKQKPRLF